jgi:hypothetical protein
MKTRSSRNPSPPASPRRHHRMDLPQGPHSLVLRHWLRHQAALYRDLLLNIEATPRPGAIPVPVPVRR